MKLPTTIRDISEVAGADDFSINKGVLKPKSLITREILLYFYLSIFLGFLLSIILNFLNISATNSIAFGFTFSIAVYLIIVKINNTFFRVDKQRLKDLVLASKFDHIDVVIKFENDILSAFQHPDASRAVFEFLHTIFEDETESKQALLVKCRTPLHFLQYLPAIDREKLYRHYLINNLPNQ